MTLTADEASGLARRIANGLEGGRVQGIVDRDLRTADVLLSPQGRIRVLGFGLGKAW